MAKRGVVNLDKLQATKAGNIESIVADIDLDNGSVVTIGGFADMGGEVVTATAPANVEEDEILLVASPETVYDEREQIYDFYNPKGYRGRAFHLYVGDYVSVSTNMIEGTPVKGKYLIPQAGQTKLAVADDLTDGTRFAAQIVDLERKMGVDMVVYRVLKS